MDFHSFLYKNRLSKKLKCIYRFSRASTGYSVLRPHRITQTGNKIIEEIINLKAELKTKNVLKRNTSSYNVQSTSLPATGCVKENKKQDKKSPAKQCSCQAKLPESLTYKK